MTATTTSNAIAEASLIGTALLYPAAFDDANVSPEDFELPLARAAWEAIGGLRSSGVTVTLITVMDALRTQARAIPSDAMTTLLEWTSTNLHSQGAKDTGAVIRKAALARRLMAVCGETLARLRESDTDAEEALSDHRNACAQIESGANDGPLRVSDELANVLAEIGERCAKPDGAAIQTGVKDFDKTTGGLRPYRQIVIAARPGEGKSAFGVQVCVHAASTQNVPVLVFSLEMTLQEQAERMLSSASNVSVSRIGRGNLDAEGYAKIANGAKKLGNMPLWIYDKPIKLDKMLSVARRWHARNVKPKQMSIVMIDYIGLVQSHGTKQTRERDIAQISQAGKALAMQHGITTLMVSQLNRDSVKEQRDPRESDLRESGSIEQDADMIIFPVRNRGEEDNYGSGPARLLVAKNRTGPTGEAHVRWEGRFTRFVDVESENVAFVDYTDPQTGTDR